MKTVVSILAFMVAQTAFAGGTPINSFTCDGQKLSAQGENLGFGRSLINIYEGGTARIVDRDSGNTIELSMDHEAKAAIVYSTVTPQAGGVGLAVHKSNLGIKLGQQAYLYLMQLQKNEVVEQFVLDCEVTGAYLD